MWINLVSNLEKITKYFPSLPDLTEVELISIELLNYSTDMHICFDLSHYPEKTPSRWAGRNTMQVEFSVLRPEKIEIRGWHYPMKGYLKATRKGKKLELSFHSEQGQFKCVSSELFYLSKIRAYSKAESL